MEYKFKVLVIIHSLNKSGKTQITQNINYHKKLQEGDCKTLNPEKKNGKNWKFEKLGQKVKNFVGKEYLLVLIAGDFRRSSSTSKSNGSFISITESSELEFEIGILKSCSYVREAATSRSKCFMCSTTYFDGFSFLTHILEGESSCPCFHDRWV